MNKDSLVYEVKRHLSDSTAIVTMANPIYAGIETLVVGMSNDVSIDSRLINTGLTFAGLGSVTKIRDYSKRVFKIGKESKEYIKGLHDIVFASAFIVGIKPMVYVLSGETDWKKIALATGISVLSGMAMAYPMGYLVDSYRQLTGVEDTGRLPQFIEKQSSATKKTLAAMLTTGSVIVAGAIYTFNGQ